MLRLSLFLLLVFSFSFVSCFGETTKIIQASKSSEIFQIRYQVHCPHRFNSGCTPQIVTFDRPSQSGLLKVRSKTTQAHLSEEAFSQDLATLFDEFDFFSLESEYTLPISNEEEYEVEGVEEDEFNVSSKISKHKSGLKIISVSWFEGGSDEFSSRSVEAIPEAGPENLLLLQMAIEHFEGSLSWFSAPQSSSDITQVVSEKAIVLEPPNFDVYSQTSFSRDGEVIIEEHSLNTFDEEPQRKLGWMRKEQFQKIAEYILSRDILSLSPVYGEPQSGIQGKILSITWNTDGESETRKIQIWDQDEAPHKLRLFEEFLQTQLADVKTQVFQIDWAIFYYGAGISIGVSLCLAISIIVYYIRRTCLFNYGKDFQDAKPQLVLKSSKV